MSIKRSRKFFLLFLLVVAVCLMVFLFFHKSKQAESTKRFVEELDRGLVAVKTSNGVFLSWRYLGTDLPDLGFDVYRDGLLINKEPIMDTTSYLDENGKETSCYYVNSVLKDMVLDQSVTVSVWNNQFLEVKLDKPSDGEDHGETFSYSPNDCSVADLDGDGTYELIVKWDPSNSKDNSEKGFTGPVIIDAYEFDGTKLWRINLGKNIRAGAHYTQFLVYDFDCDGKAEMICKTADGTIDGLGEMIGADVDLRNKEGLILTGNEYLTLFDGMTGKALDIIEYVPERGKVSAWGDSYGNRSDRFLAAVAYLDGEKASAVFCRGYYTRSVLVAFDVVDKTLKERWCFDTKDFGNSSYEGQGFHNLAVADCDQDGFDEIVYGSCVIDHDGTKLFCTNRGHGDALHVGDFDPDNPGLEAWGCFEKGRYSAGLWDLDAKGKMLINEWSDNDNRRCVAGNFIPGNSGAEFASFETGNIYDSFGTVLGKWTDLVGGDMNFVCYWDGDLEQEALDDIYVYKNGDIIFRGTDVVSCDKNKKTPSLCADILGDWREEIVWPTSDGTRLRIYTTTDVSEYRIYTLMHNPQYKCQVAAQNVGYNQPAHTDYFLGTGFPLPCQPEIKTTKRNEY